MTYNDVDDLMRITNIGYGGKINILVTFELMDFSISVTNISKFSSTKTVSNSYSSFISLIVAFSNTVVSVRFLNVRPVHLVNLKL